MIISLISAFFLLAYSTVIWVGLKMYSSAKDDPSYSFFVTMGQSFAKIKLKDISYFTVLIFFILFLALAPIAYIIIFFHLLKGGTVKLFKLIGSLIKIRVKFVRTVDKAPISKVEEVHLNDIQQ